MSMRLQKYLASCGIGSRRQCERWIAEERVRVNGVTASEPGTVVDPETDDVEFDGRLVRQAEFVYIALHKPPGYVCTSRDPQGRLRAIDLVPATYGRLFTVGRLDSASEGLILLTNDGDFANRLMHPRHGVIKTYELWLHSPLTGEDIRRWREGIDDEGELLQVVDLEKLPPTRSGFGYRIKLAEGRNRHLRRMALCASKKVLRLKRVAIGPLTLGLLKSSGWRMLTAREIKLLRADRSVDSGGHPL